MAWIPAAASAAATLWSASQQGNAANAAAGAARRQYGLSREMLDWWRNNAAPYQLDLMDQARQLRDDAEVTDEEYAQNLGMASGDTAKAFGRARDATARGLMRYGVNPSSGRFMAAMKASANDQGATEAAARNSTRRGLRDSEFAKKAQAINLGSAVNSPNYSLLGQGVSQFNTAAGNQIMGANWQAQNAAMLAQGLGRAAGQYYGSQSGSSSGDMSSFDADLDRWSQGFADGGETDMMRRYHKSASRVERDMGMAERVPMGLSRQIRGEMRGSGTPISDDIEVPADGGGKARLADGEVVIPTDTVAALGLELIRSHPERAAHMVGVKLLEERIDETHTPAEEQEENGLSVDPREGEEPEGYACGGLVKRKYADGKEARPSLGTGMAEGAASAIEQRKRFMEEKRKELGFADGGEADWLGGLAAVGKGLVNAYGNNGWSDGEEQGLRMRELQNREARRRLMEARQDEDYQRQMAEYQRQQTKQQEQDAYEEELRGALSAEVPMAGPVREGVDQPLMPRQQSPDEMVRSAGLVRAKYQPEAALAGIEAARSGAAKRQQELADEKSRREFDLTKIRETEKAKTRFGTGTGSPAVVQTVEWISSNLTNGDKAAAWDLAQQSKANPQEMALKMFMERKKAAAENFESVTDEQIMQEVSSAMSALMGNPGLNPMRRGIEKPSPKAGPAEESPAGLVTGEKTADAYRSWAKSQGWPEDVIEQKVQQRFGAAPKSQPKQAPAKQPSAERIVNDVESMLSSGKMTKELARTQLARLDREKIEAAGTRKKLDEIANGRAAQRGLAAMKKDGPDRVLAEIGKMAEGKISKETARTQAARLKSVWNDLGPTNTEKFALMDKLNKIAKG